MLSICFPDIKVKVRVLLQLVPYPWWVKPLFPVVRVNVKMITGKNGHSGIFSSNIEVIGYACLGAKICILGDIVFSLGLMYETSGVIVCTDNSACTCTSFLCTKLHYAKDMKQGFSIIPITVLLRYPYYPSESNNLVIYAILNPGRNCTRWLSFQYRTMTI